MEKSKVMGHIFAIITILVWGSCFVLTKNLLVDFTPIQIIPLRMGLAYVTLWVLRPKTLKLPWKDELMFILIGITGGSFYFYLQNTALDHTYAANEALEAAKLLAAEGIEITVINMHTIKPLDAECVVKYAEKCGNVITVEEHSIIGGLGDAVADALMGKVCCKFKKIGINDQFGQSGKAADVLREYGLTADQIAARIKETL